MTKSYALNGESTSILVALASLSASFVAGVACIGPMLGIALGLGGLGWLSRYSAFTIPASIISIILLGTAIYMYVQRKSSCTNRRRHLMNSVFLGIIAAVVVGINALRKFENDRLMSYPVRPVRQGRPVSVVAGLAASPLAVGVSPLTHGCLIRRRVHSLQACICACLQVGYWRVCWRDGEVCVQTRHRNSGISR